MDLEGFAVHFRADIRAQLDWVGLATVRADVQVETLGRDAAKQRLAALFTVWYADPAGADSRWNLPGSRPLRVDTACRTLRSWPDSRRHAVAALTQDFATSPGPVSLMLPAYRVGGAGHVLLDGNHRAVAAHQAGADIHLTLCSVVGPVCESILPDLRHYAAPSP
ncbi:hypothetical protein [Streptomyces sp. NPDC047000]|uniref:hypothetical protein n=1 Tax=Streptomyces sp. NPDC047000 TaxID=3155474 RepID=UPI0033D6E138